MSEISEGDVALAGWANEGGGGGTPLPVPGVGRRAPCMPRLPDGYEAQPAWGFRDRTGLCSYEFNRVYGPPEWLDGRGLVGRVDELLSYWSVIGSAREQEADEHAAGRWITFGDARTRLGPQLTFEQFSSLQGMRDGLPTLLHVGDIGWEPRPAVFPSSVADLSLASAWPNDPQGTPGPHVAAAAVLAEVTSKTEDRPRGL